MCQKQYRECFFKKNEKNTNSRSHVKNMLENLQNCIFREDEVVQTIENAVNRQITVTWYFALNSINIPKDIESRRYYYHELPNYYVWNEQCSKWTRRNNIQIQKWFEICTTQLFRYWKAFLCSLLLNRKMFLHSLTREL